MKNLNSKQKTKIKVGKLYKHYKGNVYKVLYLAKHSETCEDMVVYQSIKNNDVWTRPLYMWDEHISDLNVKRFELID